LTGVTITGPDGQQRSAPLVVNGISTDSSSFTLQGGATPTLVAGRSFHSGDATAAVAMMSEEAAAANHLYLGSTFRLKGVVFTLIGLYTTPNQFSNSSMVIPLATMQKIFNIDGVDSITAYADNYEQVQTVADNIQHVLGKEYDVITQAEQYARVFNALALAQNSIQLALVVSFVVAAAVIVFAVLMLVRERTAEIAIQKTIGASDWQVLRQFWIETVTLCGAAAALAVLLLLTLGPAISQRFDIDASSLVGNGTSTPQLVINGSSTSVGGTVGANALSNVHLAAATLNVQTLLIIVGVGLGLALLTSLIPIWIVSHVKPAEVLRKAA
jgi:ABC-type lipoprotein release transport system permease subunit